MTALSGGRIPEWGQTKVAHGKVRLRGDSGKIRTDIGYGQHASLRVGQTTALAVVGGLLLLLSKSKSTWLFLRME